MIAVVHAFSRRNSGDSLLVDLTLERLRDAGCPTDDVEVLALDPGSFDDLPRVAPVPGEPWGRPSLRAVVAAAQGVATTVSSATGYRLHLGTVANRLSRCDGIVAVGGGYLRTVGLTNSIGAALNHLPQLLATSTSKAPSVYLPQSIGPLRGPVGAVLHHRLMQMSSVHVRDDRSAAELRKLHNVHRTPDLAVLAVADRRPSARSDLAGPPIVVARDLPRASSYMDRLQALARDIPDARWAVQADGLGARSDATFYKRLGVKPSGTLKEVIADAPGVVVSVRLHGAIESIISGLPAIHLSYERKGWGAYEDLAVSEFVHSARHFDPKRVADQVAQLRRDPDGFWGPLRSQNEPLGERSAGLTQHLRDVLGL